MPYSLLCVVAHPRSDKSQNRSRLNFTNQYGYDLKTIRSRPWKDWTVRENSAMSARTDKNTFSREDAKARRKTLT